MSPPASQPAPLLTLNNGIRMDQLGFGVYKVPPESTAGLCGEAISAGYRHLDTASLYGNEAGVGQAVRTALEVGGLERADLFVTTKLWNDSQGYDSALRAFDTSLSQLGLEYVDLYLIHWPCPANGLFVETYRALERLCADGRVKAIGVSNFKQTHLERLLNDCSVVPAVNQVELHPWLQQLQLRRFHDQTGIRTEAWSPLGRGSVLSDPVIMRIASELGRTPAQIILRWHIQNGVIAIPKASSRERITENLDIFDFELDQDRMALIASRDRGERTGSDPDDVN